jgi:glycosyltransferase involved in cell wall biosynthesis
MRILLVTYEYPPAGAGAATAAQAIARQLVQLGHPVAILTGRCQGLPRRYEENGIVIHRVASLRRAIDRSGILEMATFTFGGLESARTILREHKIEAVIVFFSIPSGPIGLLGRWMFRIPYVVALRGGDVPGAERSLRIVHWILTPIRRAVLRNSLAITANSEGLREMAESADPFPVRMIPNGIDTQLFCPPSTVATGAEKSLQLLFVGRFQKQKNLSFLLAEFSQLPKGTVALHLVGDGPDKEFLQELAAKLGVSPMITWHGWLPRAALRDVYQTCGCLVNPSTYEGMPNVVLEAMACGLPVIASNVPGNNTLVADGKTGFLFEVNDGPGLRNAIMKLRDAEVRLRLGQAAADRARQFSSWQDVARQYVDLFSGRTDSAKP